MALLPPVIAELVARTDGFASGMARARGEMEKTASTGGKAFAGLSTVGKAALLGVVGAATAVGIAGVRMADQYEVAHARLQTALKNTGTSWDAQKNVIGAAEKAAVKFGDSRTVVEDALAVMTRGMGSSAKAVKELGLAQDLSAAKGISLSDAALLVTKASEGQIKPLKALGLDLPFAAAGAVKLQAAHIALAKAQETATAVQAKIQSGLLKGQVAHDAYAKAQGNVYLAQLKVNGVAGTGQGILDALSQKLGGSASAQAATFHGKVEALKATLDNLLITVGQWLIPKLEKLASVTLSVVQWFEKHKTVAMALGIAIGSVLVVAIGFYIAGMIQAAIVTLQATWPILLIIAAVALLAIGIYELVTHWDTVWKKVKEIASAAWDWIKRTVDSGYRAVLFFFESLPGKAMALLSKLPSLLGKLGELALHMLLLGAQAAFKLAIVFFIGIPTLILDGIGDLRNLLRKAGIAAINGLWNGAKWYFGTFLPWVASIPGKIIASLPGAISWLFNIGGQILTGLWAGARAIWANIPGWFSKLKNGIWTALSGAGSWLYNVGVSIIQGLWSGISSMVAGLYDKIKGALGGLVNAAKSALGIHSPSAVFAEIGGHMASGLGLGWQKGVDGLVLKMPTVDASTGHGYGSTSGLRARGTNGGGNVINLTLNMHGSVGLNGDALGRSVVDALVRYDRRNGGVPIRTKVA
ncbi:MAG TPA: hypothetical protein VIK61_05560 [Acidimicrobiia bacterium]